MFVCFFVSLSICRSPTAPSSVRWAAESPLQFYVNHAGSPRVTAYGPGLTYGVVNKTATFTIYKKYATEGEEVGGGGLRWFVVSMTSETE